MLYTVRPTFMKSTPGLLLCSCHAAGCTNQYPNEVQRLKYKNVFESFNEEDVAPKKVLKWTIRERLSLTAD